MWTAVHGIVKKEEVIMTDTSLSCVKNTTIKIGHTLWISRGKRHGKWYLYNNKSRHLNYWLKLLDNGDIAKIENDYYNSESVIDEVFSYGRASYSAIWGYVCGESGSATEDGTLLDIIETLISNASMPEKLPKVNLGDVVKSGKYTRNGKERVAFDAMVYNDLYITRSNPSKIARHILYSLTGDQMRTLLRLLGNENERLLPKTQLEYENAVELLGRIIGDDWWTSLKIKNNLTSDNIWIKVLKRAKGL